MTELKEKAIKKIEDGCRNYKGSKHGSVVVRSVADTLEQFCENNDDFAAAVLGEDKHFADCIAAVTHEVGAAISDIEAYRRAVRYFFPDADVRLTDADLEGMSKNELKSALYEIYARHGYIFQNEDTQEQFEEYSWYEPTIDADDWDGEEELSSVELANEKLLKAAIKAAK